MNLFDQLVTEALKNQPNLSPLRIAVEKELLHHDILRVLSQNNLLAHLTFIGGTCLRSCYGGTRLSENLDFTDGSDNTQESLATIGKVLTDSLSEKYNLPIEVSEPVKELKNVNTWKMKVTTRPGQTHLPAQRINIDICTVPSYEKRPMLLLNPYGVEMGTSGLIIQAQSREEIYVDKLLAFALRPNRIKYRDLWDIVWLHQQGLTPRFELIPNKIQDRHYTPAHFLKLFDERQKALVTNSKLASEFKLEMRRFLSSQLMDQFVDQENLWTFIIYLIGELGNKIRKYV